MAVGFGQRLAGVWSSPGGAAGLQGLDRRRRWERSLPRQEVYRRGMHKTIRDLFVGCFQDFCIDPIDRLVESPTHDFIAAFQAARHEGRVREVQIRVPPATDAHKAVWQLIRRGELAQQPGARHFGLYLNLGPALEGLSRPDAAVAADREALKCKVDARFVRQRLAALEHGAGAPGGQATSRA